MTLKGYWKPHKTSDGETAFSFIAQFIEPIFPQEQDEKVARDETSLSPAQRALQARIDVL